MPVTLGGGITIVYGSRSPPTRSERAASAAKHPASSHAAYTSGSVMEGSYLSGSSVIGLLEAIKSKRAAIACGSLFELGGRAVARADQCRRSSFALRQCRGPRRRVRFVRPLRVAALRDRPSVRPWARSAPHPCGRRVAASSSRTGDAPLCLRSLPLRCAAPPLCSSSDSPTALWDRHG